MLLRRDPELLVRSDEGLAGELIGVDMAEASMLLNLQKEGLNIVDGQQTMMRAREIKSRTARTRRA